MKRDVAEAWVSALRSGDYKQAQGFLQSKDGFCCLGVLCEVAIKDGLDLPTRDLVITGTVAYDNNTGVLPPAVVEYAGMNSTEGTVSDYNLTRLNDEMEWDFTMIADFIEKNVDGL